MTRQPWWRRWLLCRWRLCGGALEDYGTLGTIGWRCRRCGKLTTGERGLY